MTFNDLYPTMSWYNAPAEMQVDTEKELLIVTTKKDTDFWQQTHYGFKRDDGHFLSTEAVDNFLFSVKIKMLPQQRYDQAGLMLRLDEGNWAKTSVEYIPEADNKLGSVVTKDGFSDWATMAVPDRDSYYFRIIKIRETVYVATSIEGEKWETIRLFHMKPTAEPLQIGVYACSPQGDKLEVEMSELHYEKGFTDKEEAYT